ncbi:silencing gene B 102 [Zea mays]|uniref:Silencing gene B 102 n=1 Tax=Zea mays TaxID=4577 RepID=A0A1D6L0I6_MAIZE|nr:silencing gene B 102 [Zea mays]
MTTIRRFCCDDLLRFASVNLDHLTETFNMSFYMTYLARWPDYFHAAVSPGGRVMGYSMSLVTLHLCLVFIFRDKAYFVDLFVRASNMPAIRMYEKVTLFINFSINALLDTPIGQYSILPLQTELLNIYQSWLCGLSKGAPVLLRGRRWPR